MLLLCFFKAKNKDAIILNTWFYFTLVYTKPHLIVSISLTADQLNLVGRVKGLQMIMSVEFQHNWLVIKSKGILF